MGRRGHVLAQKMASACEGSNAPSTYIKCGEFID
jgi:hypothetical protein